MAASSAKPAITDSALAGRGRFAILRSRVARRVLLLFLFVAALPIVLTATAAFFAIDDVTEAEAQRVARAATRAAGQTILGQLQAAQELLASVPAGGRDAAVPGLGRVFLAAMAVDAANRPLAAVGHDALSLGSAWQAARDTRGAQAAASIPAELRTIEAEDGRIRVLISLRREDRVRWIAEIAPSFLWDLIEDPQAGSRWEVRDGLDRVLFASAESGAAGAPLRTESWRLFLGASLRSADWQIRYAYRLEPTTLHGSSFTRWLVSAAVLALMAATLLAFLNVRRTLGPLAQLDQGTRALARREHATRIRVDSDDEFADLAAAFNRMAERIELQFRALEQGGAIDRSMLAGEPAEAAADQVLGCLQALLPQAHVAFLLGTDSAMQAFWRLPGDAETRRTPLQAAAEWEARVAAAEAWLAPAEADWASALPFTVTRRVLLITVPRRGRRAAALLLAPHDGAGALDEVMPLLRDLRDRLAVGLSADERRRELERRAVHDSLTGAANRRGLIEHLEDLAQADPVPMHAVLFVDLDRFKGVNDSLGHDIGDEVIVEAAERLRGVLRSDAVVARPGGDEFVAVVRIATADAAMAIASRIGQVLAQPFHRRGRSFVLGASIGVALGPEHGRGHAELLRRADLAMYAAKQAGRGTARLYDASLDAVATERAQLLSELHAAIELDQFVVEYQPRIDAEHGTIVSAEALVRWQHPQRGRVMPMRFIPIAEEAGLIEAIDAIVLDRACAQWRRWADSGIVLQRISVNMSAQALGQGRVVARVRDALAASGVPAAALELEITESVLAEGSDTVIGELCALQRLGVTLALDDFGTGYSAMAVLRRLPVDVIKIDRAFVKDVETDPMAHAVLGAVMVLAEALNLRTVAEGVETEGQRRLLQALRVDELQGYLIARPCGTEAFEALPGLDRATQPAELA
jgi:diguanylate cyclase (GGDEF)-like protein